MRGILYYDSKYGSTEQISIWIAEKIYGTELEKVSKNLRIKEDCAFYIVGTPIFISKPTQTIIDFINVNKDVLLSKPLFLFITSWAQSTQYRDECKKFITLINSYLSPCVPVLSESLPGRLYMDKISKKDRSVMQRLLRRIDNFSDEFDSKGVDFNDQTSKEQSQKFGCEINEWLRGNLF